MSRVHGDRVGPCAACGREGRRSRSHILPEFLYRHAYDEDRRFAVMESRRERVYFNQKGHREHLLCPPCEAKTAPLDDYGAKTLTRLQTMEPAGTRIELLDVDPVQVHRFLLSVLWRCHASTRPDYGSVRLGPHAGRIQEIVFSGSAYSPADYPVALTRIHGAPSADTFVIPPVRARPRSHLGYLMLTFGFYWLYVVSSRGRRIPWIDKAVGTKATLVVPVEHTSDQEFLARQGEIVRARRMPLE